jgi:ornithine decarboxylase
MGRRGVAIDEAAVHDPPPVRWRRARVWARRYLPAEAAGLSTALLGTMVTYRITGSAATAAFAGSACESIGYYATTWARDLRRHYRSLGGRAWRAAARTSRDLAVEFGPAEIVDSLFVRPGLMYAGRLFTSDLIVGTLVGKVAADVAFYAIAISGYEFRTRAFTGSPPKGAPTVSSASTPYLAMDLDAVSHAYRVLAGALPGVTLHYAVKCNPDPRVLDRLRELGCRFEIASAPELELLGTIGVHPADVLFSNPVKTPAHIAAAHAAGVRRYAFDSTAELDKIGAHAPGASVYVRLSTSGNAAQVPSEGKFGVGVEAAGRLLRDAAGRGLDPHGVTFHVGSQTTDPLAWDAAIESCGRLMDALLEHGIRLRMVDIGGGFPAAYVEYTPHPAGIGKHVGTAVERYLPYPVDLVAEPGRALVAEAGTMVATVIGVAERHGRRWVHLDVGAFNGMMEALETGNRLRYPVSDSRSSATVVPHHVTGPTCDSQDTVLHDAPLSASLTVGDTVYIHSAGAYTTSYASRFNGFDLPATLIT